MVFASGGRSETTANQCEEKRQEKRYAVNGIQLKSPHISTLPTHCCRRYHDNFVQGLLRWYMTLPDHRAFDFLHQSAVIQGQIAQRQFQYQECHCRRVFFTVSTLPRAGIFLQFHDLWPYRSTPDFPKLSPGLL